VIRLRYPAKVEGCVDTLPPKLPVRDLDYLPRLGVRVQDTTPSIDCEMLRNLGPAQPKQQDATWLDILL
jgi:hypothetical protein